MKNDALEPYMAFEEVETPYGWFAILCITYFRVATDVVTKVDTACVAGQTFTVYNSLDNFVGEWSDLKQALTAIGYKRGNKNFH